MKGVSDGTETNLTAEILKLTEKVGSFIEKLGCSRTRKIIYTGI